MTLDLAAGKTFFSWEAAEKLPAHLSELMPAQERQVLAAKPSLKARAESVAGRMVLRSMLLTRYGMAIARSPIACTPQGALHLVEYPALFINISHTTGLVAAAVSETAAVGIDVEKIDHGIEPMAIADRFFHRREIDGLQALEGAGQRDLFFALWTGKEAAAKALGIGLGLSFPSFHIQPRGSVWIIEGLAKIYVLRPLAAPSGFKAALALAGEAGTAELQSHAPAFVVPIPRLGDHSA